MARPTEARHLLFAGEGTARFCNYWTKAISRMFFTLRALPDGLSQTEWDAALISANPSGIVLAALLASKYAFQGTLLRFVWIPNISEETDWRAALLHSMLLFSIAHEFSHFVAHETKPEAQGTLSEEESQNLELWCDTLAIRICGHIGRQKGLIHVRAGLGAIAFCRVLQICHAAKEVYASNGRVPAARASGDHVNSHPDLDMRVEALVSELIESADPDEKNLIETHLSGLLGMLQMMQRLAIWLIEQSLTRQAKR